MCTLKIHFFFKWFKRIEFLMYVCIKKYVKVVDSNMIMNISCKVIDMQSLLLQCKVEKILKGSLDSISSPSPSVNIQIMGGTVCLRCKGKTLLGVVNKLLKTISWFTSPSNVLPQVNFPANNLNFYCRWRWWDQIFLNIFYFTNNLLSILFWIFHCFSSR